MSPDHFDLLFGRRSGVYLGYAELAGHSGNFAALIARKQNELTNRMFGPEMAYETMTVVSRFIAEAQYAGDRVFDRDYALHARRSLGERRRGGSELCPARDSHAPA